MSKPTQARVIVFVIGFSLLSLIICEAWNAWRERKSTQENSISGTAAISTPTRIQSNVDLLAAQTAAQERAQWVAKYLNSTSPRQSGVIAAAVVASSEAGRLNNALATALAQHFKSTNIVISTSLFTPEFISDGLFDNLLGGSSQVVNQLELAKVLNTLVLAKQTVEYSRNPELANTTTANMRLDITILSATSRGQSQSWSFTASGAGFSEMQARGMAEERILKQIEKDSKMSLNL